MKRYTIKVSRSQEIITELEKIEAVQRFFQLLNILLPAKVNQYLAFSVISPVFRHILEKSSFFLC